MQTIAIIDYGMGNLRSVAKAVEYASEKNIHVHVTADPDLIRKADRVIFPGQGAVRACMQALSEHGLNQVILEVSQSKPFLGICMGLQVLMSRSDENYGVDCFNVFPGKVSRFIASEDGHGKLKVPHMGWNQVQQCHSHPLWVGVADSARFYFVHSYYVIPEMSEQIAGVTHYAIEFASALAQENIFAVQFHPEKSAAAGLTLLKNFIHWNGED